MRLIEKLTKWRRCCTT